MNFKEIKEILDNAGVTREQFSCGDFSSEELGLGFCEEVDQEGGEGEGDHYHTVKWFKDHNIYIRIDGFHQSEYGVEYYDDMYEVFPKVVSYTEYHPK